MEIPIHPLLALLECNANCLKSMLTHYIDVTVDSQFASLWNSFETMIQSGMIGSLPNHDVSAFGTTLPTPKTQANTNQSSAQCTHEYSNDQLTRTQKRQNTLQREVSLSNTINTNDDVPMIKQEFDHEEEDGEEIDDDSFAKCKKCENGICNSVCDNYDDTETEVNEHRYSDTTQLNVHDTLETQTNQPNDISPSPSPSPANPINTEPQIKQKCLQGSSITSIPLDFDRNAAALNDIAIDEQIEGQNTQIQTDEFDDNVDLDDDYYEGGEDEYSNLDNSENEVCNLDHKNNNNHLDDDVSERDGDETDLVANLDETQFQIDFSVTNNTQMNMQNDDENAINDEQESTPSTSGIRPSTHKQIKTKVFGDLVQSNVNPHKSGKRKSDQANESAKKAKRKQILDDDDGDTDQEDNATNAIGEESIATECTTNLQCSHCLKSFDFNSKLQQHLLVHTGERPFQCDQCDKRFKQKDKLKRHQLIHQNMKRFGCKECAKRFTLKQHLDSHFLIHSGERPFTCCHCNKSFTQSITRTKHEQAIHLHVKPYRCKQCGHTATYRSAIITHIRVIHFGLPPTLKEQRALNIIDDRDPKELVEKV